MTMIAPENEEAIRAWDGVLFDRFSEFRALLVDGLARHGTDALAVHPPGTGERVLDIGCGFGDATREIAGIVGPSGAVVGLDAAPRFIEAARAEAGELDNVRFEVGDLQTAEPDGPFDAAFARFGTMFFANPVVALRNVNRAMRPGGRLTMVVWRRREDNPWTYRAELLVKRHLEKPEESDEPTCGPGPFSMAGADTVSDILLHAGFTEVEFRRNDLPLLIGENLDRAVALVMALGPGAEILRLLGDRADHVRPQIERELREMLTEHIGDDGRIWAGSSTWIVSALATGPEPGAR